MKGGSRKQRSQEVTKRRKSESKGNLQDKDVVVLGEDKL